MSVLVIAAHPDDEVLGCGGTIARLAASGERVFILIMAEGLTSRADFDPEQDSGALNVHHQRAEWAGKLVGAENVTVAGFPDQKMDTIPLLDVTQRIEQEIDQVKPHTLFTQHGGDLNMDHAITFRASLTATRPTGPGYVKKVLAYEVPSSTEWSFQKFSPVFQPSVFVDITDHIDKKISAMQIYESETRVYPHPRSPEALRAIAQRWGSTVGCSMAEAFHLVREIQ